MHVGDQACCPSALRCAALLAASLSGCRPSPEADDSGWLDSGADTAGPLQLTPVWGPDEVKAALDEVLAQGLPEPFTMRSWFFDISHISDGTYAERDCPSQNPTITETEIHSYWANVCSSDEYSLNGGWYYDESYDRSAMNMLAYGLYSMRGTWASGERIVTGGSFYMSWEASEEGTRSVLKLGGTFQDEKEDGWLGAGISSGIELAGELNGSVMRANLRGSLGVAGESFVQFDDVFIDTNACPTGITRDIRVRDPSTIWLRVSFGDTCSECGTLSWGDEELGEVCVADSVRSAVRAAMEMRP